MRAALEFDVCIVGSGVAGGLLAAELASTGKRIAIVEAGSWHDRGELQRRLSEGGARPYLLANPEHLHVPITVRTNFGWGFMQSKKIGGNSLVWGAWAVRPLPAHFRLRALHGVGQDWPLGYEELEPFYCRAEEELGVSGQSEGAQEPPRSRPYPLPAFPISYAGQRFVDACRALGYGTQPIPVARPSQPYRDRVACCIAAQCWTCPTGAKYSSDLIHVRAATEAKNVTLLEQTVASRLNTDRAGRVESLLCHRPDRTALTVKAGVVVLACNAIEGARLLLQSAPGGVANASGQVGRALMVHPTADVGAIAAQPINNARSWPTVYSRHFEEGPHRRTHAGFRLAQSPFELPALHARALIEQGLYGKEFRAKLVSGFTSAVRLMVETEMLPDAENRIELDPEHLDHFGNPGMKITVNLGDYERGSWGAVRPAVEGIFRELKATPLGLEPQWSGGGHQLGTLAMGTDPRRSVVDRTLRAHDLKNLYVASTATFPNSLGPTNPTLTLAALTLRLAGHLRTRVLA